MTDLSRKILDDYQVRKSKTQKDRFITLMQEYYPQLQIQTGGLLKSRNLIIGDINSAKIVLTAHYDTCAQMIVPNFITPKNPLLAILYGFAVATPICILVGLMNILLGILTDNFMVHYLLSVAMCLVLMYLMIAGPANRHTANDNTSGVITLCQLLHAMTPEQQKKTAVVFFDNEELGLIGSTLFRKRFKKLMSKKLLVNFDCVSDGDYLFVAPSKLARKHYDQKIAAAFEDTALKKILFVNSEKAYYPSDQAGYPQHIAIAALKHNKLLGYYMDRIHTKKDTVFDEMNIETLCKCTQKLINLV